ncbi:kelch-like protein 23 [Anolis carolinensis]|uniref:kelch-like protein 23 n=1 Tax=Anolis carolinensis TaxID=28377 RepID=UPI002F2B5C15
MDRSFLPAPIFFFPARGSSIFRARVTCRVLIPSQLVVSCQGGRGGSLFTVMEEAAPATDVVLEVGGGLFPANRGALSQHSRYFQALFFGGPFRERCQKHIRLHGVEAEPFGVLLSCIQTGIPLAISRTNVASLLEAADFLALERPKRCCEAFLERELRVDNCLGLMAFAERFSCPWLFSASRGVALTHFEEVAALDEMLALSPESLSALMRSDWLFVSREDRVLEALLRWVNAEPAVREKHFLNLVALVRGPCLSLPCLDRLIRDGTGNNVLEARLLRKLNAHLPQSWAPGKRGPCAERGHEDVLVLAGRHDHEQQQLLRFQPRTGAWRNCAPLLRRNLTQYAVAAVGDLLYVTGGFTREEWTWSPTDGVLSYSSWEDRWEEGPPLRTARHSHCAAGVGGRLFVAGGALDGGPLTPDVESLAPGEATWRSASPMARPVERAAAAGVGSRLLFVVGGLDESGSVCPAVQRLDTLADAWDVVARSPLPRYDLCAAALNGGLFTVGGGALRLETDTGEWTPLEGGEGEEDGQGGTRLGRGFFKACVAANGRLYLLGQRQGNSQRPNLLLLDPYLEPPLRCRELDPQVPCPLPIQAAATVRCFGTWH